MLFGIPMTLMRVKENRKPEISSLHNQNASKKITYHLLHTHIPTRSQSQPLLLSPMSQKPTHLLRNLNITTHRPTPTSTASSSHIEFTNPWACKSKQVNTSRKPKEKEEGQIELWGGEVDLGDLWVWKMDGRSVKWDVLGWCFMLLVDEWVRVHPTTGFGHL